MVRIVGVNLPDKKIPYALSYIYGIGFSLGMKIVKELNIDPNKKTNELTNEEINKIQNYIEKNLKVENDLKREIQENIKRLIRINCYRGIRHLKKLPVRGQRTRTNSRTVRGNIRHTVTSGKRKLEKK